ncbi:nucleoporin Nup37 isoform X2 [Aquarana catesbeiana]|uniref:nucleoporin Nup37 isoform X2 n=1 Tax=Aquarana catesbeiana TaxID=8400 RepID=UPI003CC9A705
MKQDTIRGATYTVDCEDYIHVVEFNPFDSVSPGSLIAYGGNDYVAIASCRFQEEDTSVNGIEFKILKTFHHEVRVDAITWSPETRYDTLTPVLRFCTAAGDKTLRIFTSDFHEENKCQLMVAEKTGTIRFYDLTTHQAILSLESMQVPLMSADWCLKNTFRVGAVAGNDWVIWEMPRSSYPQDNKPSHADRARFFRWSKCNENLFATTGCPGKMNSQLLIHHLGHPHPILVGSASVGSGLSWHRTLPLCVVGGYRKLFFWLTEM